MPTLQSRDELRAFYKPPVGRAVAKQLDHLDPHCQRFIALSPFVVMATHGRDGLPDASPRGGQPGFVAVADPATLLIPDWPGNNRLDSLENILDSGRVGLLFLIPGVDETLRVNGEAVLSTDEALLGRCPEGERLPKLVIRVAVREAYLHCAKALMRSELWSPEARIRRESLPTMGQMLRDQTGGREAPESQEAMLARYREILY